ncbi:Twin-arginine translocation pathway signal [Pseudomonas syringae pv. primulae]|uniref:Twin-arginine translocation pathway signal n=1 Tax=Pseudomonas syringae pv. primulae TaxID=251707 RepID=A0A0P9Y3Y3_9PSED|nr:Twin-arginine translocation pathway signal [Pseudomonas syringae pv. primulae]
MSNVDRRSFMKLAGIIGLSAALPFSRVYAADAPLVVGFIYVGARDDFGYNQAHAQAAAIIKTLPNVKVIEEENVPETVAVQKTMEAMIRQDGATLIFATSFGYFDPHVVKVAKKYPDVRFAHCGGLWKAGTDPANAGSFFGYIDEAQYLNGVVAGHMSKSKKLGFVAAKPVPQVLRNLNAFAMGARSVDPSIVTTVIFTGDWSLPIKEAEAANSLIDQGCDVLTCHVDGPKVIVETAEKRGAMTCGYHASQAALAPQRLSDRCRMELGNALQSSRRRDTARRADDQFPARRFAGRFRQDVTLRTRRQCRSQEERRRDQGPDDGRRLRDLQRPAQGQQRQGRDRRRRGSGADRYRAGKHELSGGRRCWPDLRSARCWSREPCGVLP